jgi:hypothetical protein
MPRRQAPIGSSGGCDYASEEEGNVGVFYLPDSGQGSLPFTAEGHIVIRSDPSVTQWIMALIR